MTYLWENPKFLANLISHSDINDIKENLSYLIVNNFYENILSSNCIEDNLMYIFALLLKQEISNLSSSENPEIFLDNTPSSFLLSKLTNKPNIQTFFKTTIVNEVEKIEVNSSNRRININVNLIQENILRSQKKTFKEGKEKIERNTMTLMKTLALDKLFNKKERESNATNPDSKSSSEDEDENNNINNEYVEDESIKLQHFSEKYVPDLKKSDLKKKINNEFKENDKMKDYCINQINFTDGKSANTDEDDLLYSNKTFMSNVYCTEFALRVLQTYKTDFLKILNFIEEIILSLKNNLYLLPYSVKCLCKIISILINKKFPNASVVQKNAFIAVFFFDKLFLPILRNPGMGVLINNFIISGNTRDNLKIIADVISKLVSGKFFINNDIQTDFTPFNHYFLDKMPEMFSIFEQITEVTLPPFIEKLINDELNDDFVYDYFKENPDEEMFHRAIFFNLTDITCILNNINNNKEILFNDNSFIGLKKTFEKLYCNKYLKFIEELKANVDSGNINDVNNKNKTKDNNNKQRKKEYYFLLTSLLTNKKYKELLDIKLETPNFTIKEIKETHNDDDIIKNNVIKVKNYLSSLLYNYKKLAINDFDQRDTSNMVKILKLLKIYMKSSSYLVDNSIPSEWYVNSLLSYLKKIPKDLTENDYEKLFDEMENEINLSIKELDFEALCVCIDRLKFSKNGKDFYEQTKILIKDIEINEKVKEIVEKEYIPVEINFEYGEKKSFEITKSKLKEKQYKEKKKKEKINKNNFCKTIKTFTQKFPNLIPFQKLQDIDLFDMQKELEIPQKLTNYFDIIKEYLISKKNIPETELEEINNKIYDYVMTKIHDKIYPIESEQHDDKIFQQCIKLSWVESKHFMGVKTNYTIETFLPDVMEFFKKIEKEKSPRKKIMNMKEIFNSIYKVVKFNGGKDTGVDDSLPILNYAFIKARPMRIFSDSRYMELYIGNLSNKEEGSQLMQLLALCNFVENLKNSDLLNVSEEEFVQKCNEAASCEIKQMMENDY